MEWYGFWPSCEPVHDGEQEYDNSRRGQQPNYVKMFEVEMLVWQSKVLEWCLDVLLNLGGLTGDACFGPVANLLHNPYHMNVDAINAINVVQIDG